jgi:hypothetical protein
LGSGNGGCAAVAGYVGVERVIIHDLQKDIQPEQWITPDVMIPALSKYRKSTYYERSTAGYGPDGGDLSHKQTWEDLQKLAPVDACVVYDVVLSTVQDLAELVFKMVFYFPGSPLITRWILPIDQLRDTMDMLNTSFETCENYIVYADHVGGELVSRITINPANSIQPFIRSTSIHNVYSNICTSDGVDQYGGSRSINWDTEFGDFDVDVGDDEHLLAQHGQSIVDDSLRKSVHGYSYSQWTEVLKYKLCKGMKDSGEDIEESVARVVFYHEANVMLRSSAVTVVVTKKLKDFMLRTLPRCI